MSSGTIKYWENLKAETNTPFLIWFAEHLGFTYKYGEMVGVYSLPLIKDAYTAGEINGSLRKTRAV